MSTPPTLTNVSPMGLLRQTHPSTVAPDPETAERNRRFREELVKAFPAIVQDWSTFMEKSTCSCRGRIIAVLSENLQLMQQVADQAFGPGRLRVLAPAPPTAPVRSSAPGPSTAARLSRTIKADPEAYKTLMQEVQRQRLTYVGVAIMPAPDASPMTEAVELDPEFKALQASGRGDDYNYKRWHVLFW